MGILKFLAIFCFFYFMIKIVRSIFLFKKTVNQFKDEIHKRHTPPGEQTPHSGEDIIEADYKVLDE